MHNNALKEKLIETIGNVPILRERVKNIIAPPVIEKIAEAIIAANFIDRAAEHRAEITERALESACEDLNIVLSFLIDVAKGTDNFDVENYSPEECEPKAYIDRAKKELAEEYENGEKEI